MKTHIIKSALLISGILLAFISNDAHASFVYREDHPILDYYDLLYSDIVIIGVIENIDFKLAPIEEVIGEVPTPFKYDKIRLGAIRIRVNEVLKGRYETPYLVVLVEWDRSDLRRNYDVGDTTIISAYWRAGLLGGSYAVASDNGRFIKRNNMWFHQAMRSRPKALTREQIRAILEPTRINNIILNAELIVVGKISGLEASTIRGPAKEKGILNKVIMQIDEVHKGNFSGKEVEISMIIGGPYWPAWRQKVPRIRVGEEYYVFLRKGPIGFYPFAGINGFFKLVDDKLIYDNRVEFELSKRQLDDKVAEILGEVNNERDRH